MTTKFNGEGDPYSTAQGYLTIHANGGANPPYGGMISCSAKSYNVTPGTALAGFRAANAYWEAKLLIPAAGSERWCCFWVIGSTAIVDPITGQYGEVDIIEFPNCRQGLHYYVKNADGTMTNNEPPQSGNIPTPPAGGWSAGWHIFGALIQTNNGSCTVDYFIDGVLSHHVGGLSTAWSVPMEVILDNSFGQGLPASGNSGWTNDLGVQYVRCWTPQ
jgi:hypothetical protein